MKNCCSDKGRIGLLEQQPQVETADQELDEVEFRLHGSASTLSLSRRLLRVLGGLIRSPVSTASRSSTRWSRVAAKHERHRRTSAVTQTNAAIRMMMYKLIDVSREAWLTRRSGGTSRQSFIIVRWRKALAGSRTPADSRRSMNLGRMPVASKRP